MKNHSDILSYGGTIMLIGFGYFATLQGIEAALHSVAIILAAGALALGAVFATVRPKISPDQLGASGLGRYSSYNMVNRLSTWLAVASSIVFFVEVNLSLLSWRETLGALALVMYLGSLVAGAFSRKPL